MMKKVNTKTPTLRNYRHLAKCLPVIVFCCIKICLGAINLRCNKITNFKSEKEHLKNASKVSIKG
jgi:hypothetical protein